MTTAWRRRQSRASASPLILVYIFAGLIAVGTALLMLPATQHGEGFTPFMDAFFTATSAVAVTGLVVQDTPTYWTSVGQIIVIALVYVGGLGFMTVATFMLILIGQRLTLTQRLLVRESLGVNRLGGLVRLTVGVVILATLIQLLGFGALLARFWFVMPQEEAMWHAAFLSISSFNNAGFMSLTNPDALSAYRDDAAVLGIMAGLILLGSIGYATMADMVLTRRFSLFALNTKFVLIVTGALLLFGCAMFLLFEHDNPNTIGELPVGEKLLVSAFESTSGRTAGFSTVEFGETREYTSLTFCGLMLIGGATGSVAGGIKVNAFAIIVLTLLAMIRGRERASAFRREVPRSQIQQAMAIGLFSVGFVFLCTILLSVTESGLPFLNLLFESFSAAGTVGLSRGITPIVSTWGQIILIGAMFIGRVGPVTLGLALGQRTDVEVYRNAQERVTIG